MVTDMAIPNHTEYLYQHNTRLYYTGFYHSKSLSKSKRRKQSVSSQGPRPFLPFSSPPRVKTFTTSPFHLAQHSYYCHNTLRDLAPHESSSANLYILIFIPTNRATERARHDVSSHHHPTTLAPPGLGVQQALYTGLLSGSKNCRPSFSFHSLAIITFLCTVPIRSQLVGCNQSVAHFIVYTSCLPSSQHRLTPTAVRQSHHKSRKDHTRRLAAHQEAKRRSFAITSTPRRHVRPTTVSSQTRRRWSSRTKTWQIEKEDVSFHYSTHTPHLTAYLQVSRNRTESKTMCESG